MGKRRHTVLREALDFFSEALRAALILVAAPRRARLPHFYVTVPSHPSAKRIDAEGSGTVIRLTLPRYTLKSLQVNYFLEPLEAQTAIPPDSKGLEPSNRGLAAQQLLLASQELA